MYKKDTFKIDTNRIFIKNLFFSAYCIQGMFEKCSAYTMNGETFIIREPLNMELIKNRETLVFIDSWCM